ncbi:MAG: protein kinase [Planctomycetes bacterium]|nr:protein kinase [Planctomycetota bacterium]
MKPIGKYTVVREIGRGGMGVVFEGFDPALDRPVAVKLLLGERDAERFAREAKAAARVNHPNCVTVFDVGEHDRLPYLVMELVRGASAAQLVARRGRLPWKNATRVAAAAARGLAAVHAAGLVHRDVKPSNLLVTDAGVVKVGDFGLATSAARTAPTLTGDGVVGTPHYMSPEQCLNEPVDARTDVYALGATYFNLLTGQTPFRAGHDLQVMFAHCNNPVPDPRQHCPDVPDVCAEVVLKAMAKNPADRYQSMGELLAALVTALSSDGADTPTDPSGELAPLDLPPDDTLATTVLSPRREPPRPSRRKLLFALPAAAVAGGGGYALVKALAPKGTDTGGGEKPPPPPPPPPVLPPLDEHVLEVDGQIMAVAVSHDGRSLAVAYAEPNHGGAVLFERQGNVFKEAWWVREQNGCWGVAIAPHKPWLAVAVRGAQESIRVWDTAARRPVDWFGAQNLNGAPRALAFSPDGARFAAGVRFWGQEHVMVRLWETADTRQFRDLAARDKSVASVRCASFSPDGSLLLATDDTAPNAACAVWDAKSGEQKWFRGDPEAGMASAGFARSRPVFACSLSRTVRCYSVPTFEPVGRPITAGAEPQIIALSPDGRTVALKLGCVALYDTESGRPFKDAFDAPASAWSMTFTPDGQNLIVGHIDKKVRVWKVPKSL